MISIFACVLNLQSGIDAISYSVPFVYKLIWAQFSCVSIFVTEGESFNFICINYYRRLIRFIMIKVDPTVCFICSDQKIRLRCLSEGASIQRIRA